MMMPRFDWDERKNRANQRKHGVTFEDALTVFADENAMRFPDPDHSVDENRFILLGISYSLRVLVISHCYRENPATVRIISARKADKMEETDYWRGR